ncbi:SGNH/GDSL hydrolase family protein [Verrucomicrobiales bacterium]|jgi:lysophospholipase L1-like esterase|nr:SGNH/GDSL hydrolase family protein [Verrucomicrobiales bacterium]MDB2496690.1 SGNH/GDSL hydrolase family protein [Verrucomicrobiales bacterium]MDC3353114.1 SGNH/GDSL hydrolase family protein [Verrucomicrobiales bacterium]
MHPIRFRLLKPRTTAAYLLVLLCCSISFVSDAAENELPTFEPGSRLVFIGDSITDMKWGRNEKDRNHYLGHSFVFLIAARLGADMPDTKLDFYNRGHSGNTVADLKKRWKKDAIDMKPDVLTILVGTNDAGRGVTADAFESDYREILNASRKANPKLKIVMLDPFAVRSGKLSSEAAWNARGPLTKSLAAVVRKLAKEFEASHIPTQEIFDKASARISAEHWIWDGVHPLPQGHELIARHWIEAMK